MANGGNLLKSKNRDISETVWLIFFYEIFMMTHISPPDHTSCSNQFLKILDGG